VAQSPEQLKAALERARKATVDGKPYLIDAQVARRASPGHKPWTPPVRTKVCCALTRRNVMQMLKEACLWVGLLSVPLSWVVWFFGPRLEVDGMSQQDHRPALKAALEEAHAERWGIFVGPLAGNASLAQLILESR